MIVAEVPVPPVTTATGAWKSSAVPFSETFWLFAPVAVTVKVAVELPAVAGAVYVTAMMQDIPLASELLQVEPVAGAVKAEALLPVVALVRLAFAPPVFVTVNV